MTSQVYGWVMEDAEEQPATMASDAAATQEDAALTQEVLNAGETASVPTAYSDDTETGEWVDPAGLSSRRRVAVMLTAILVVAGGVAAAILLFGHPRAGGPVAGPAAPVTSEVAPAPAAPPAVPTRPSTPATRIAQQAPPVGAANDVDAGYLATLQNHGLVLKDPAAAIEAGHAVCELRGMGSSSGEIADEIVSRNAGNRTYREAVVTVTAALVAYCPWYS